MPSNILFFLKYAGQNECYATIRYRIKNLISGLSIRGKICSLVSQAKEKFFFSKSAPGPPENSLTIFLRLFEKASYFRQLLGTSVLMYRDSSYRDHQWFTFSDWPGGIYATPTISGSRAGGVIAATWAAMVRYVM